MSSVADVVQRRISTRAFLDTPVSQEAIAELLELARWSPSGGNLQPWRVVVVTGDEKRAIEKSALAALAREPAGEATEFPIYPSGLGEPYKTRRFEMGEDLYQCLGISREEKALRQQWLLRNFTFFGAPVGVFFIIDRQMGHGQWAHVGMFMQTLALLAQERGLATCFQEAWAMVRDTLHAHLNLNEGELLYCGMALGFPDTTASVNQLRTQRAPVAEFAAFLGFDS